jgi:hypothetical protein
MTGGANRKLCLVGGGQGRIKKKGRFPAGKSRPGGELHLSCSGNCVRNLTVLFLGRNIEGGDDRSI